MTELERMVSVISLLGDALLENQDILSWPSDKQLEFAAQYLLSNGVNLPPCKVGDTVYQADGVRVYESVVKKVIYDTDGIAFDETAIGTSVFTRREQAEVKAALNKLESENN